MMMAGPEKKSTYKENAYMDDSKQDWWELSLASKLKLGKQTGKDCLQYVQQYF